MKVALVVMPFAAADSPSLAAGLLKAALTERGISCDVKYFNLTFAGILGCDTYQKICTQFPSTVLAGEWSFARLLFPDGVSDRETYFEAVLRHRRLGIAREDEGIVESVAAGAPLLLQLAADSTDWASYDVVAFTSNFEQTMPSMALAREIRQRAPGAVLVAGGANFEAGMGRALFGQFGFLDYVCLGEGDVSFPQLCESISRGTPEIPSGMLGRNGEPTDTPPAFADLDDLPIPDFDDYFSTLARTTSLNARVHPWIPLEASRGCWWGEKAHCTFCGLNGERMQFRHKSARRIDDEVRSLTSRYGNRWLQFSDNILSMPLFEELFPTWSSDPSTPPKFFEVKAGMRRDQIARLKEAGVVRVQAGVESLSTATLKLMKKGLSAAMNIAVLRWCHELGVEAHWNILWGFPGEPLEDYVRQLAIVEQLTHLHPPQACCEIRLDRFSPNHTRWKELGFSAIRPAPAYRHVFPFEPSVIEEIAYFFDFDHQRAAEARAAAAPLASFCRIWRSAYQRNEGGTFAVLPNIEGGWTLVDRRFNRPPIARRLTERESDLLVDCDEPVAPATLMQRGQHDEMAVDQLTQLGAILDVDGRFVTIPLLSDRFRNYVSTRRMNAQSQEVSAYG